MVLAAGVLGAAPTTMFSVVPLPTVTDMEPEIVVPAPALTDVKEPFGFCRFTPPRICC